MQKNWQLTQKVGWLLLDALALRVESRMKSRFPLIKRTNSANGKIQGRVYITSSVWEKVQKRVNRAGPRLLSTKKPAYKVGLWLVI